MSTFALVHGAWHGPWCWERVVEPLVGPVVARRRPLRALVYLCALVPETGLSFGDQLSTADEPILTIELVNPGWSRRVARERLGIEPVEIPTGHFPMITHPELLADSLARLAAA